MTTPFDGTGNTQADGFGQAPDVSNYPKLDALRGALVLITPTRLETGLLSSFSKPGQPQYQDRITANVVVLDKLPLAGFDSNEFTAMYFSQTRLVAQLQANVGTGRAILGRLDTYRPGEKAQAGNPWGIQPYSDADAAMARAYLAGDRSMIPAPAPAQAAPAQQYAPQAAQAAPAAGPWAQPAPQANPWPTAAPSSPQPGTNPFG